MSDPSHMPCMLTSQEYELNQSFLHVTTEKSFVTSILEMTDVVGSIERILQLDAADLFQFIKHPNGSKYDELFDYK